MKIIRIHNTDYSEKEVELFNRLDAMWALEAHSFTPILAYRDLATNLFIENKVGLEVDSVRRILNALHHSKIYRLTEEFDNLIEFEEKDVK
jgi:hypothetical protein